MDYAEWVDAQRKMKDVAFGSDPQSPIEDKRAFRGLRYYPPDPAFRVAARWESASHARVITIPTSTGEQRRYTEAGRLHFELSGEALSLVAYDDGVSGELFVPFRDSTSGKETYGAGRYLGVEPPDGEEAVLDFNLAYNPYCAYSDAWSCPLPPAENWLKTPVRAGEMAFNAGT